MTKKYTHIYPVNDIREHITNDWRCWCIPEVDDEHYLIIHNAADGREKYETGERKPN